MQIGPFPNHLQLLWSYSSWCKETLITSSAGGRRCCLWTTWWRRWWRNWTVWRSWTTPTSSTPQTTATTQVERAPATVPPLSLRWLDDVLPVCELLHADHLSSPFQASSLCPSIRGNCMSLTSGSRSWSAVLASNPTRHCRSHTHTHAHTQVCHLGLSLFLIVSSCCSSPSGSCAEHRLGSNHPGHIWCQLVLCECGRAVFPLPDGQMSP